MDGDRERRDKNGMEIEREESELERMYCARETGGEREGGRERERKGRGSKRERADRGINRERYGGTEGGRVGDRERERER